MPPVDLVTVHHEGSLANGGAPSDNVDRFAHGGYCCGIGATLFKRFRAPADNWATLNFNGQDWTPCFSGDHHTGTRLTDTDIALLHDAFLDAYNRGEVTAQPSIVRAHRNSPGSSTACPGDFTIERWNDVVRACSTAGAPKPEPEPEEPPMDLANAINHDGRPVIFQVGGDAQLYFRIRDATGGNWGPWRDLSGGFRAFATVTAFVNTNVRPSAIEVWVTMADGKTFHRWQTGDDRASWSGWNERTR